MNTIPRTLALLPVAAILGFGIGVFYLVAIITGYHYHITGHLPDVSGILDNLSGLERIAEALGG